jgi:hypothetical protein
LEIVARGAAMYELDLVGVLEVRWDRGCTEPAGDSIIYFCIEV